MPLLSNIGALINYTLCTTKIPLNHCYCCIYAALYVYLYEGELLLVKAI